MSRFTNYYFRYQLSLLESNTHMEYAEKQIHRELYEKMNSELYVPVDSVTGKQIGYGLLYELKEFYHNG